MTIDARDRDALLVGEILKQCGLVVEGIPRTGEQTCDLRAVDNRDCYFIEVKRFDDDEAVRDVQRSREPYCRVRSRFSSNAVSDRLEKAVKQLAATAQASRDALRIVALIAESNYGADLTSILGTLYGIRKVGGWGSEGRSGEARDCLYFSHSAFFRHRSGLDGVLVLDGSRFNLFLNDYGERAERLRQSGLARSCRERRAFRDTASFESKGCLIADCDADRNDQPEVLRYLERKYGLTGAFPLHSFGYQTLLPFQRSPKA